MTAPKAILNQAETAVDDFLQGLLLQFPNHLKKLENHHVLVAANHRHGDQVHLISGGGSGHEPSHAGWIGSGMLTAAVCGGMFASPSVASILAAIRALKTPSVLLIVKNYTGDRLNFGMACELANQEGISCQMVVVADDCAMEPSKGITGARGVAGTVLLHKILGAAAAQGTSHQDLIALSKTVHRRIGTLGIALDSVTVPGAATKNERLDHSTIEIGLGIHGEAGRKQSKLLTAKQMALQMIQTIRDYPRHHEDGHALPIFTEGDELVLLVNNLGGTSNFEMAILAKECVQTLETNYQAKVSLVLVGAFMTSFQMHGASLTILNVSGAPGTALLAYLNEPTDAPAWTSCDIWKADTARPSYQEIPEVVVDKATSSLPLPPLNIDDIAESSRRLALVSVQALIEKEPLLTKYDTIVGDGDCGITMKRGATEILSRLQDGRICTAHPVTMYANIADAISASMGGTSGILLELMFRKMSSSLALCNSVDRKALAKAFCAGVDAVQLYGGATTGSRTMLDALIPAAADLGESLTKAATHAQDGADRTAEMKVAEAGRSNYLSEDTLLGTPDPGAVAVATVLTAMAGEGVAE